MNARKTLFALSLLLAFNQSALAKTWKVNLKDAEISALVSEVSEITGKNFIVDPRVKGNITVISSKPMSAILKAIENPREIDYNLVNAQQARRVLDRLVGCELSPVLWTPLPPSRPEPSWRVAW